MITNKVIFILKRITPVTSAIKISVISVNAILVNIFLMVNTLVLLYCFWNNMTTLFSFNSYFYSHLIFLISWTNTISFTSIKLTSFHRKSGINTIYWRRLILHYSFIPTPSGLPIRIILQSKSPRIIFNYRNTLTSTPKNASVEFSSTKTFFICIKSFF